MPNVKNYVLLETITVGAAGASSVTFNNIPQTGYTDLKLVVSARCDSSAIFGQLMLEINSSGTITDRLIQGDGSAANSYTNSVGELGPMVTGANATANTFGSAELYFPNYAGSANKSVSVDGVSETNATTIYQVLTTALRANTSPITSITLKVRDGSQVSKNFVQYSTFSLYGLAAVGTTPTIAPKAAGGDIIQTDGTYWYHAFITSGTFTPAKALSADVLVVAGGGGGGGNGGGGGGAGGLRNLSSQALSASTSYTCTVGAGGNGGGTGGSGSDGTSSSIAGTGLTTISASGGGGGGYQSVNGRTGGSGGGGGKNGATKGTGNSGGYSPVEGYNGGDSTGWGAAGGGGATAVGGNSSGANGANGGVGGAGSSSFSSWLSITGGGSGNNIAGGGGGGTGDGAGGAGGTGGGGAGGGTNANGTAAAANTASGGGGGGTGALAYAGAAGGSGIVIIRYAVTA